MSDIVISISHLFSSEHSVRASISGMHRRTTLRIMMVSTEASPSLVQSFIKDGTIPVTSQPTYYNPYYYFTFHLSLYIGSPTSAMFCLQLKPRQSNKVQVRKYVEACTFTLPCARGLPSILLCMVCGSTYTSLTDSYFQLMNN